MFMGRPPWEPPQPQQFGQQEPLTVEESWIVCYTDNNLDPPTLAILKPTSNGPFLRKIYAGQAAVDIYSMLLGEEIQS